MFQECPDKESEIQQQKLLNIDMMLISKRNRKSA